MRQSFSARRTLGSRTLADVQITIVMLSMQDNRRGQLFVSGARAEGLCQPDWPRPVVKKAGGWFSECIHKTEPEIRTSASLKEAAVLGFGQGNKRQTASVPTM